MIVLASHHQVRCIPWVQMGIFNKEIGFLCGIKFFALNIFCGEYLPSSLHLMLQIWWNRYCERCANKKWCVSKHTGLFNSCLGKLWLHPYLVVPLISARVTLISTRVSAHCQAILLKPSLSSANYFIFQRIMITKESWYKDYIHGLSQISHYEIMTSYHFFMSKIELKW